MRRLGPWLALAGLAVVAASRSKGGGGTGAPAGERPPADSRKRVSSLELLQPRFRAKVEQLIATLRGRGFDAKVFETFRTRARLLELVERGTSVEPNADGSVPIGMHELGLAADIISESQEWDAPDEFWQALGLEAEALGLTWGGRWISARRPTGDRPHVQAIPIGQQPAARARFRKHGYAGVEVA